MSANPRLRARRRLLAVAVAVPAILLIALGGGTEASAADGPIGLGTAGSFAVLGGSGVSNTGLTVVDGDLGVSPDTAVTGFTGPPDGTVLGTTHAADGVATQAQVDLTTAFNEAAGLPTSVAVTAPLGGGGPALPAGVYTASSSMFVDGILTLDAGNVAGALFVFQAGSTLITASSSSVVLINGADACNVYWQVGSSATLGTTSTMVGTVMADQAITATTGANVTGRLLARNAAVTLDDNDITRPLCTEPTTTTTEAATTSEAGPTTTGAGPTTTVAGPTTTVAGPTTTIAGPTTTIAGPTTTIAGPTTTVAGPTTTVAGPTTTVPVLSTIVTGPTTTIAAVPQAPGGTTSTTQAAGLGTTTVPAAITEVEGGRTTSTTGATTSTGITTGDLARTGSDTSGLVIAGVLTLVGGTALLATSRRLTRR